MQNSSICEVPEKGAVGLDDLFGSEHAGLEEATGFIGSAIPSERLRKSIEEAERKSGIQLSRRAVHIALLYAGCMEAGSFSVIGSRCFSFRIPFPYGKGRKLYVKISVDGIDSPVSFDYRCEREGLPLGQFLYSTHFSEVLSFYDLECDPLSMGLVLDAVNESIGEDASGTRALPADARLRSFFSFPDFLESVGKSICLAMSRSSGACPPSYERAKTLFRNVCALMSWRDPYQRGIARLFERGFPLAGQVLLDDAKRNGLPYLNSAFLFLPEEERPALLHGTRVLMEKLPSPFARKAAKAFLSGTPWAPDILCEACASEAGQGNLGGGAGGRQRKKCPARKGKH